MGGGISNSLCLEVQDKTKNIEAYRDTSLISNSIDVEESTKQSHSHTHSISNNVTITNNAYKLDTIINDEIRFKIFMNFISNTPMKIYVDSWLFIEHMNNKRYSYKASNNNSTQISIFFHKFCSNNKQNIIENIELTDFELNTFNNNDIGIDIGLSMCPIPNNNTNNNDLNWLKQRICIYIEVNTMKNFESYEIKRKYRNISSFIQMTNVSHEDFKYVSILGQGTFGMVLKCRMKNCNDKSFAMKVQLKDDMWQHRNGVDILIEQEIFEQHSEHPYIMDCICSFNSAALLYLVMPVAHCTLSELVKKCPDSIMSLSRVQFYVAELVCVLKYLHENSFIYCDLKLSNVMVGMDGHVQLTDFGSTCRVASYSSRCKLVMGTLSYMAPEVILGLSVHSDEWGGYTSDVDWWSLGILTYKLLVGKTPFEDDLLDPIGEGVDRMPKHVLRKVKAMNRYTILFKPVDYSMLLENFSVAVSFIKQLLEAQEYLRLGYNEVDVIYTHQFFDGLEWDDIDCKTAVPPSVSTEATAIVNIKNDKKNTDFLTEYMDLKTVLDTGTGKLSRLNDTNCRIKSLNKDSFNKWKYNSPNHILHSFFESEISSTLGLGLGAGLSTSHASASVGTAGITFSNHISVHASTMELKQKSHSIK